MLTVTIKMTIIIVKMTPDSAFEILYAPIVGQQLDAIEYKYFSSIREAIEEHLSYEPDRNTRNRKPLKRPAQNGAQWELQCGPNNRLRIFYTIDRERREVFILAIGEKQGSRLMLGGEEVDIMKIASIADVKAKFSGFIRDSEQGPVVVTRNGKPVAVLLSVRDEDEIEQLIMAYSPKFQAILAAAEQQVRDGQGIKHDAFWQEIESAKK